MNFARKDEDSRWQLEIWDGGKKQEQSLYNNTVIETVILYASLFLNFIILLEVFVAGVRLYISRCPQEPEDSFRSPWSGVTTSCELCHVGPGNRNHFIWEIMSSLNNWVISPDNALKSNNNFWHYFHVLLNVLFLLLFGNFIRHCISQGCPEELNW